MSDLIVICDLALSQKTGLQIKGTGMGFRPFKISYGNSYNMVMYIRLLIKL
jgi:hypothetical protein